MQLFPTEQNPAPAGAKVGAVTTADGLSIRTARWRQSTRQAVGTVVLLPGHAEFIEKYFAVIQRLRRRGLHVIAMDWRGQGGSERQLADPRKAHVDDFDLFALDLDAVLSAELDTRCPRPHVALAHSMGAAALLLAMDRGERRFDRAVLSAPLIDVVGLRHPWLARFAAGALDFLALGTAYIPGGGATVKCTRPFEDNRVTANRARYREVAEMVAAAPHLGVGDPTIRWVDAMFRAMARFRERDFGRRLETPSLMLLGGRDRLCDSLAAEALSLRLRGCRAVWVPEGEHEMMFDTAAVQERFWAAFDAFVPGTPVSDLQPAAEQDPAAEEPANTEDAGAESAVAEAPAGADPDRTPET
jgi:lysophospholipase